MLCQKISTLISLMVAMFDFYLRNEIQKLPTIHYKRGMSDVNAVWVRNPVNNQQSIHVNFNCIKI